MAKSETTNTNFPDKKTWTTWEELLLAFAVHRYGTDSWDAVALEIQKRSSTLHHRRITPTSCRHKYRDLNRRFSENDAVGDGGEAPWLDELRKLRVAELKREVQRYDLSILSMESTVKRLEEERERSLGAEISDLDKVVDTEKPNENELETTDEPAINIDEPVENDKTNRLPIEPDGSPRELNEVGEVGNDVDTKPEMVEEPEKKDRTGRQVGEDSCRGSCGSEAKESPAGNSERVNAGDSPESVAESKRGGSGSGEERGKENSDVQSSASLSRNENDEPDEPDNEGQYPSGKRISIESQPLADFLEILRSHKCGSFFERRRASQERPEYTNLIRQHIDLETIRKRLEDGSYIGWDSKFFRDLLLLLNNATLFYNKKSAEYNAAVELKQLVLTEIRNSNPNPNPNPNPIPIPKEKTSNPLSVPTIACRKRSSITAKASTSSSGTEKKPSQKASLTDEKPISNSKQKGKPNVTKKRTTDRSRKPNENIKTRYDNNTNTNNNNSKTSEAGSLSLRKEGSSNKKTNTNAKKQGVNSFLNRMKRGSSLLDTLSNATVNSEDSKGEKTEPNKKSTKIDKTKDQSGSKRSNGKNNKEVLKKPSVAPPATPQGVATKRGREVIETDAGSSGLPKKRTRR